MHTLLHVTFRKMPKLCWFEFFWSGVRCFTVTCLKDLWEMLDLSVMDERSDFRQPACPKWIVKFRKSIFQSHMELSIKPNFRRSTRRSKAYRRGGVRRRSAVLITDSSTPVLRVQVPIAGLCPAFWIFLYTAGWNTTWSNMVNKWLTKFCSKILVNDAVNWFTATPVA